MAIGNVELVHECFPKQSCMKTASIKYDKETDEEIKDDAYDSMIHPRMTRIHVWIITDLRVRREVPWLDPVLPQLCHALLTSG